MLGTYDPGTHLHDLARRALGCALHASRGEGAAQAGIRETLRDVCAAAHARGLHAEQVLVILKEAWRSLPDGRDTIQPDADAALGRVVSLCISEYYAVVPSTTSAADRDR